MKEIKIDLEILSKKITELIISILKTSITHIFLILLGAYIGTIIASGNCHAKVIYYGSEAVSIKAEYGAETIFRFNQAVKTISRAQDFSIRPLDKNNPDYAILSVKPRSKKSKSSVTFILANGKVIQTQIVTVSKSLPENIDNFYDFLPKEKLLGKNGSSELSDMELMKAMIRWDEIVGVKIRTLNKSFDTGMKDISARLVKVYSSSKFNGYVFKVTNKSKSTSYSLDPKILTIGSPNQAILSQIDKNLLNSKESTFIRIVAKTTSIYSDVTLPIGPASN